MRLSSNPRDPGYAADAAGAKVFLDGAEIESFITADEEGGWVRDGKDVVHRGKVEIVLASQQPAPDISEFSASPAPYHTRRKRDAVR